MAGFVGALVGYLVGGFWWGVAWFFIARLFSQGLTKNLSGGFSSQAENADRFFDTVFALLGVLAKADGRVSEDEIAHAEALMARLGLSGDRRDQAIASFKRGTQTDFPLQETLQEFALASRFRPDLKRNLVVFLVEMAMADDELHADEEQFLRQVANGLRIDARHFEQLLAMLKAQHSFAGAQQGASSAAVLSEAYRALGVTEQVGDKELKRAYRKLMSQYHPDKMIAKGVPKDMLEMATEKTQEIQAAYEIIAKSRKAQS